MIIKLYELYEKKIITVIQINIYLFQKRKRQVLRRASYKIFLSVLALLVINFVKKCNQRTFSILHNLHLRHFC